MRGGSWGSWGERGNEEMERMRMRERMRGEDVECRSGRLIMMVRIMVGKRCWEDRVVVFSWL